MTNQGDLQQAIRDITSTTYDYNGDWHALFDNYSITSTNDFNGRLIEWLQDALNSSETNLDSLKQAYASSLGVYNWNSITSFAPILPNLQLWLDASDTDTVRNSSGAVYQWDDKSGNGNHATQGAGSSQPTTGSNTLNSKNVITFNGTAHWLAANGIASVGNSPYTIFQVFVSGTHVSASGITYAWQNSAADLDQLNLNITTSGQLIYSSQASNINFYQTSVVGTPIILTMSATSSTVTPLINNGAGNPSSFSMTPTSSSDQFSLGQEFDAATPSNFYNGDMAEVLVYNRVLSSAESLAVNNYLANKWGISI